MIVALVACGLTGGWATDWKETHGGRHNVEAQRGALSGMNSYSLALMLGGLRGPLVMVLWSKVENQKIDRDLEDVDTMIEWIRLLQPEFDTVHIFQIWNKAYNISALMASTVSKYTTILDAADYARRVDADRPGDLNIMDQLARLYGEKLGGINTSERFFYRKQFVEDSMTDANRVKAYPEDAKTYHRYGLRMIDGKNGPILDDKNNLRPELLVRKYARPTDLPANSEWNTGAELQYLDRFQPFPYGVPPIGVGYNYSKRAQVAMTVGGQKPLQLSESVIDTYPALLAKQWGELEQERAFAAEAKAFGSGDEKPDPAKSTIISAPDAKVADRAALELSAYGFGLSAQLAEEALKEFERHLSNPQFVNPYMSYTSHMEDCQGEHAIDTADYQYVSSFLPGADRTRLLIEARAGFRDALTRFERIVLSYAVEARIRSKIFPPQGLDVSKLPEAALDQLYGRYMAEVQKLGAADVEYDDQRNQYGTYIVHAAIRLDQLKGYEGKSVLEIR
jgi:hypothetical protein